MPTVRPYRRVHEPFLRRHRHAPGRGRGRGPARRPRARPRPAACLVPASLSRRRAPHPWARPAISSGLPFVSSEGRLAFPDPSLCQAPFSLRCCLSFSHRELVFRRPAWRHSRSSLRVRCCPVRVSWQSQMPTPRGRLSPVRGQLGSAVQGGGFLSAGPTQGQCGRSTRGSPVSGCDAFPRRGGGQFQRRPKGQRLPRLTAAAWTRLDEQEERRSGRWCGSARGPGGRAWQGGAATLTRSCTAFRRGLSS